MSISTPIRARFLRPTSGRRDSSPNHQPEDQGRFFFFFFFFPLSSLISSFSPFLTTLTRLRFSAATLSHNYYNTASQPASQKKKKVREPGVRQCAQASENPCGTRRTMYVCMYVCTVQYSTVHPRNGTIAVWAAVRTYSNVCMWVCVYVYMCVKYLLHQQRHVAVVVVDAATAAAAVVVRLASACT